MRLKTFSPSMYKTFKQCERKTQYAYIEHLCTICFKGETHRVTQEEVERSFALLAVPPTPEYRAQRLQTVGLYACKLCGQAEVKAPQLVRGSDYDDRITAFIRGQDLSKVGDLPEIRNTTARETILHLAGLGTDGGVVKVQERITLDAEWNASPDVGRTITLILDALYLDEEEGYAQILDWKTGSLTKSGKKLKSGALDQYIDQLEVYALGVLAKYPKINHVDTACYFLDADCGRSDSLSYGRDENYQHVKEQWTRRLLATMATEKFDPTSGYWCSWCSYSAAKGGPCVF